MEKYLIMAGACEPYNPNHCPASEWEDTIHGVKVECRKVWIAHDVIAVSEWFAPRKKSALALSLSQHFAHLARSNYGQPYVLLADGKPIIQLEIVGNKYSELSLHAEMLPDDYCMYLQACQDQNILQLQVSTLYKMLEWFQTVGIWRLWMTVGAELPYETALILRAGFDYVKSIADKYDTGIYCFAGHGK